MPIAKITGQGLVAIALSVGLLWASFVSERLIMNRSYARRAEVMRDLRQMQLRRHTEPASTPMPTTQQKFRTTVG